MDEAMQALLGHGVLGVVLVISLSFNWYLLKRIETLTNLLIAMRNSIQRVEKLVFDEPDN